MPRRSQELGGRGGVSGLGFTPLEKNNRHRLELSLRANVFSCSECQKDAWS